MNWPNTSVYSKPSTRRRKAPASGCPNPKPKRPDSRHGSCFTARLDRAGSRRLPLCRPALPAPDLAAGHRRRNQLRPWPALLDQRRHLVLRQQVRFARRAAGPGQKAAHDGRRIRRFPAQLSARPPLRTPMDAARPAAPRTAAGPAGPWLRRRRLEPAGHTVATVSLVPPYTSLVFLLPQLNQRIEEVCAATGSRQVTLIAHSMGGLVCRSYLARHGNERIDRLLTLATPHQGTALARIGIGQNAREMEPGSLWLTDMAAEALKIPVISLRNPYDNYAMPQDKQRLPGATDIELPATGHLAILYDSRIAELLLGLLKQRRP